MERTKSGGNILGFGVLCLAGVLLLPGCVPGSSSSAARMENQRGLNSAGYRSGNEEARLATEPIVRLTDDGTARGFEEIGNVGGGRDGWGSAGLSVADDAKILRCVDEAFDLLMVGDAIGAVEILTEAQTVRYWAQSRRAASVLYWLGQAHERLEERTAARAAYRKVLRLYADSVWSKRARKRLTALSAAGVEELMS